MRRPRFTFWIIISLSVLLLFEGAGPIITRLQDNWLTSLILLAVGFFYNGRFGYFHNNEKNISARQRTIFLFVAIVVLLLGIFIEVFLYNLPEVLLIAMMVITAIISSVCLFYSSFPTEKSSNLNKGI